MPRLPIFGVCIARRLIALVALCSFLTAVTGVPVPIRVPHSKDRSQPYPCIDHACGCASAEQCWKTCCCFTHREKLVWCAQNGVQPPEFVVAAAEREPPTVAAKSCCAPKIATTCCEQQAGCEQEEQSPKTAAKVTFDFVLAIQARKCQGQAEFWLALGAVSLPPARIAVAPIAADCGEVAIHLPQLRGISTAPEAPPPRV